MTIIAQQTTAFGKTGFAFPVDVLSPSDLPEFRTEADRLLAGSGKGGTRNIFIQSQVLRDWAMDFCGSSSLQSVEAADWCVIRGILFNKSPEQNWALRWHQDSALAFKREIAVAGFGPWSAKEGIAHAIAPTHILEKIVTVRLHLDDTDKTNGALEILPDTHLQGRLSREEIRECAASNKPEICTIRAGEAMLMRPLLIHRSAKCTSNRQRRVIHAEFAPGPAPKELEWAAC